MARVARWILIALAAVVAVIVLRIGGELHYSGCVDAATVRYEGATDKLSNAGRATDVQNCTRSPFIHTGQGPVGSSGGR